MIEKPKTDPFPKDLKNASQENKRNYIYGAAEKFMETYVLQKFISEEDDYIRNYALMSIFLTGKVNTDLKSNHFLQMI